MIEINKFNSTVSIAPPDPFPNELWDLILKNLNLTSLGRVSRVCRYFKDRIDSITPQSLYHLLKKVVGKKIEMVPIQISDCWNTIAIVDDNLFIEDESVVKINLKTKEKEALFPGSSVRFVDSSHLVTQNNKTINVFKRLVDWTLINTYSLKDEYCFTCAYKDEDNQLVVFAKDGNVLTDLLHPQTKTEILGGMRLFRSAVTKTATFLCGKYRIQSDKTGIKFISTALWCSGRGGKVRPITVSHLIRDYQIQGSERRILGLKNDNHELTIWSFPEQKHIMTFSTEELHDAQVNHFGWLDKDNNLIGVVADKNNLFIWDSSGKLLTKLSSPGHIVFVRLSPTILIGYSEPKSEFTPYQIPSFFP